MSKTVQEHIASRHEGVSSLVLSQVKDSLTKEGISGAIRNHSPHVNRSLIMAAAEYMVYQKAPPHDMRCKTFSSLNFLWKISEVFGLDGWTVTVSQSDGSRRNQMTATFYVCDVAVGVGIATSDSILNEIRKDVALRIHVARAITPAAQAQMEASLLQATTVGPTFKQNAKPISKSLMSVRRLFPYISLTPRIVPNQSGNPSQQRISVDVSMSVTFELGVPLRNEGTSLTSVQIEENSIYFSLAEATSEAVDVLRSVGGKKYTRCADMIEAISPPLRRKHQKQVVENGGLTPTRQEVIQVGEPDLNESNSVEITIDETGHPFMQRVAGIQEDVKAAGTWWKSHVTLIKPPLSEIATKVIHTFGEAASPSDIPTLVDMAMGDLEKVADKRRPSYGDSFGFDAAVAGLGQLLQAELTTRLR